MKKQPILLLSLLFISTFSGIAKEQPKVNTVKTVKQYTTAETGNLKLAFVAEKPLVAHVQPNMEETNIFIQPATKFQTVLGIGGALTDASAETFAKMPVDKQTEFLNAYYSPSKGIGYTLARTNINSCDFSSDSYTYIKDNDKELKTFTIAHDLKYRVPFIKKAIAAAGGNLTLFASPWSPPAWMKDNNNMLRGGKLLPAYYQSWATYFVRFIQEYQKAGIPVWGISVQNEPMASQSWESCIYTATEERDFVKNFLGPTLWKMGMQDKKVIILDHNRDLMFERASVNYSDLEAAKYIWGMGFHWYEDWAGGKQQFENVKLVNDAFPDKKLLFTEGCIEKFDLNRVNDWKLGERYGLSMINDFNNGVVGWTDWNILLDEQGGPNHVKNFCFAPIHYNTKTNELLYTSEYYYIGHFSKFIQPGAKRISGASSKNSIIFTAFQNTNGKIAVVVMNQNDKEETTNIWLNGKSIKSVLPKKSISTFVIG